MSDKEKLETSYVIKTVKREAVIAKGTNNTRNNVNLPLDLVLILIEQAERVQKLEEELNKQLEIGYKFEGEIHDLEQQNKRYREALEFYANRISYLQVIPEGQSNIEHDKGKKAREALEENK